MLNVWKTSKLYDVTTSYILDKIFPMIYVLQVEKFHADKQRLHFLSDSSLHVSWEVCLLHCIPFFSYGSMFMELSSYECIIRLNVLLCSWQSFLVEDRTMKKHCIFWSGAKLFIPHAFAWVDLSPILTEPHVPVPISLLH